MRKSRFGDEQIVAIVREAEAHKGLEVCRRHGISKDTLRRWRTKYRGMGLAEARRLKPLEAENRRLKKLVADQALDLSLMKDLVGRTWGPRSSGGARSPGSGPPAPCPSGVRAASPASARRVIATGRAGRRAMPRCAGGS